MTSDATFDDVVRAVVNKEASIFVVPAIRSAYTVRVWSRDSISYIEMNDSRTAALVTRAIPHTVIDDEPFADRVVNDILFTMRSKIIDDARRY